MDTGPYRHVPGQAVKLPIAIIAMTAALIWWIFA